MKIGIEQEFVFKDSFNNFLDFSNSSYKDFQQIVDIFPEFEEDKDILGCKSLEKTPKRCYVEGFERYDTNCKLIDTVPKALEIRTIPYDDINKLVDNFASSYNKMKDIASSFGLFPVLTSSHPFRDKNSVYKFFQNENYNGRSEHEIIIAKNSMLTYGLHINISATEKKFNLQDILEKFNFYLPYIIPFSFSSPFLNKNLFEGLCYRNYIRAKNRQLISIRKRNILDVIEFRAFDAIGDLQLLKSVLLLIKFLVIENSLSGRKKHQDIRLIEISSMEGFENSQIKNQALMILDAAKNSNEFDSNQLDYLYSMVQSNESYAVIMKQKFNKTNDIIQSISNMYNFGEENVFEKSA